jgi:hypothetical protein
MADKTHRGGTYSVYFIGTGNGYRVEALRPSDAKKIVALHVQQTEALDYYKLLPYLRVSKKIDASLPILGHV